MIQNLKNMLKMVYFSELSPQSIDTKHFKKQRPIRLQHSHSHSNNHNNSHNNNNIYGNIPANIKQICGLIHSDQRCENWIIQLQAVKQNYIIKQQLYNAIMDGTVNIHNLFLMMIQCRVLGDQAWVGIDRLCRLKGDRDNQLCCLIHFTVMNLGKKYGAIHNPPQWSRQKAQLQMGDNFQRVYNSETMQLQQKIIILPMLIVLNQKNSPTLYDKLPWLHDLPMAVISSLRANMIRLSEQRVSSMLSTGNNDYFTSKMCIKSIQLLQEYIVQGFVSVKNLFAFGYQLYNISLLLELLAGCRQFVAQKQSTFRLQLIQFLTDLMDCINSYQFDFDYGKNTKDVTNLRTITLSTNVGQIIINNKLYLEQLNQIKFNQELQGLNRKLEEVKRDQLQSHIRERIFMSKVESATKILQQWFIQNLQANKKQGASLLPCSQPSVSMSLARVIPRLSSQDWLHNEHHNYSDHTLSKLQGNGYSHGEQPTDNQQPQQQQQQSILTPRNPQQKITRFCNERHETILNQILCELYQLKSDYLHIVYCIMHDCYLREEQPYSQMNSSFYKLQLYLSKKYLLQFLVVNYNSLETRNNPLAMISYYKILGYLVKGNPINYGKLDRIIMTIEEQMGKQNYISTNHTKYNINNTHNNNKTKSNIIKSFTQNFTRNISLSKTTILMILSDQFQWKQNQCQKYANATYESYFVAKIINEKRMELMVAIIENVCEIQQRDKTGKDGKDGKGSNGAERERRGSGDQLEDEFEKKNQKYQWITLLLTLYYYFQQIMEPSSKQRKYPLQQQSQKYRINTPNKLFFDKILEQQKFMQKLYPIHHTNQKTGQKQKILHTILIILDDWQQFYLTHSKKSIMQYNLSFPILRVYKKKIKARIAGFVKTKEYQQNGEEFYQKYVKRGNKQQKI